MINGDPHDFIDTVYSGQDIVYLYHGIKYWYQGYLNPKTNLSHMEVFQYNPPGDGYVWEYDSKSPSDDGLEAFLEAPIFDGKTFWEAESEIEWVDY